MIKNWILKNPIIIPREMPLREATKILDEHKFFLMVGDGGSQINGGINRLSIAGANKFA
jgi:hypothetical protein